MVGEEVVVSEELLGEFSEVVSSLRDVSQRVVSAGLAAEVSDDDIAQVLYAAARVFAAKSDRLGKLEWPISEDALNATETVVLVNALLDAADINLFDMAIWYRRAE